MLTVPQQAAAALVYIKKRLEETSEHLKDGFFLGNLNYNFVTLFGIYTGALDQRRRLPVRLTKRFADV